MEIFISGIVEWLGERHGPRERYGWYFTLSVAVALGSVVVGAELAAKKKKLLGQQKRSLGFKPLKASLITNDLGFEVAYDAVIKRREDKFLLEVFRMLGDSSELILSEEVSSLDLMDQVLRDKTKFIMADFK